MKSIRHALFFLLFPVVCFSQNSPPPSYADELIESARSEAISQERYWHLLLHYRPRWLGGVKSEADGPGFFNAPDGKWHPQAELEATIRSFFAQDPTDPNEQHPQCKFIGRYRWLKERLHFDPARLPEKKCDRFEAWRNTLAPESMTMVFASYYLNNPASTFGHTLIRFDHKRQDTSYELLEYAINYAANTGNDGGIAFAVLGLTGGYAGTFASYPYYFKVQEYNSIESRDLWEYHLNIPSDRVQRVLEHLWELGSTYFDYYFVDENCSYHLLSLLEIADPALHLTERYHFFVSPSDTIKAIYEQKGLVSRVAYRPSLLSLLAQKEAALKGGERRIAKNLAVGLIAADDPSVTKIPANRQALVLDTALNYLTYKHRKTVRSDLQFQLSSARSHLGESPSYEQKEMSTPPHLGHDSTRVGFAGGANRHDSFEEFRFRPAYHDVLASDAGYPPNSGIEAFDLRLRYYNEENKFRLEKFTAIQVFSLSPLTTFIERPSWNVSFGVDTLRNDSCTRCNAGFLEGGAGIATDLSATGSAVLYILANAFVQASPSMDNDYRLGPKANGGILMNLTKAWKMQLYGTFDFSPVGLFTTDYSGRLDQRFSLTRNTELRLEGTKFKKGEEGVLALQVYF